MPTEHKPGPHRIFRALTQQLYGHVSYVFQSARTHPGTGTSTVTLGFFRALLGRSSYRHALSIGTQTAGTLLQRTTVGV